MRLFKSLSFSIFVTIVVLFIGFQNCFKQSFRPSYDTNNESLGGLSFDDAALLKEAEINLQKAGINIYTFLDILQKLEAMAKTKDYESLTGFSNVTTPEENLKRIQFSSNLLSRIFGFLNSIPPALGDSRYQLSSALDNLRQMQAPKADDMVLKSLVLLIEIKTQLVEELRFLDSNQNLTQAQKSDNVNLFLKNIADLLSELMEALIIAKPSSAEALVSFRNNFQLIIQLIVEIEKGAFELPPGEVAGEIQLINILILLNSLGVK